jgi:hypothetical protein
MAEMALAFAVRASVGLHNSFRQPVLRFPTAFAAVYKVHSALAVSFQSTHGGVVSHDVPLSLVQPPKEHA